MQQKFDLSLGMQGNIERALQEIRAEADKLFEEIENRKNDRIELEQMATDLYLDQIQSQQDITDLQLQVMEMGAEQ